MATGTPTAVGQATRGNGSANLVTGTITFTTDSKFYVFGFCRNAGGSTFSNSQTLSMTAILDDGTSRVYAQSFVGDGSSGTVLFNGGAGPAVLQVIEVTGCDETPVQSKVGNAWGGGANNAGVTFDSTPASTAVSIAAVGFDSGSFTSSDTEIQQDQAGGDGLATAFTTGTDDTIAWTHGGTTKSSIGFELAEASGGGPTGIPIFRRRIEA